MTLEDRIVLAGIALVLAAGLALSFLPHLADTFGSLFAPQPEPVPPVPWARYSEFCGKPASHDEADLCQQWRSANAAAEMSWSAFASLFIGALSIVGLFITLWLTRNATLKASEATRAAVRSAEAAERTFLIENRPWMNVELEVRSPVQVDDTGNLFVGYSVKATNVSGHAAIRVGVFGRVFSPGSQSLMPAEDPDWVPFPGEKAGYRTVVFPGGATSMTFFHDEGRTDAASPAREAEIAANSSATPLTQDQIRYIRYGVEYGSTATDQRFVTAYVALLHPSSGSQGFRSNSITPIRDTGITPLANLASVT